MEIIAARMLPAISRLPWQSIMMSLHGLRFLTEPEPVFEPVPFSGNFVIATPMVTDSNEGKVLEILVSSMTRIHSHHCGPLPHMVRSPTEKAFLSGLLQVL
jgi:hypothetical protein